MNHVEQESKRFFILLLSNVPFRSVAVFSNDVRTQNRIFSFTKCFFKYINHIAVIRKACIKIGISLQFIDLIWLDWIDNFETIENVAQVIWVFSLKSKKIRVFVILFHDFHIFKVKVVQLTLASWLHKREVYKKLGELKIVAKSFNSLI